MRARELLAQLAQMLPHSPTSTEVLERVLWLAQQFAWCDSAALFVREGDKLALGPARSPHGDRLAGAARLGVREPVVLRALREAVPVRFGAEDEAGHRIFFDEPEALAVPLHDQGVLYLGRRRPEPFDDSVVTDLVALCQQGYFALRVARTTGAGRELRREEAESRRRAEGLLEGISTTVELMSELLGLTDPADVLARAGESLSRLAEFDFWAIAGGDLEPEPRHLLLGPDPDDLDREAVMALARLAAESGRTVSLMNMERLTLPQPSPRIRSVLISPLTAGGRAVGCIMLGSARACFSRQERELLSTLALQVGSHFWNLQLHQDLRAAHRSLELSQAQLVQASKLAAVGRLAAGVAHELNTPLAAVNLAIEGALKILETKPARAAERLERALRSGRQLREIVAQLLHYSRKSPDRGRPTDLKNVVMDALSLVRHSMTSANVTVRTELSPLPPVLVNANEIQQVVVNLLNNARDAVVAKGAEEREIVVAARLEDGRVTLHVADPGTGMDEATLSRVFDPFFTTKEVGQGTGLGLSVSKEILDRNGVAVSVQSAPGQGTTVSLAFPPATDGEP